MKIEVNKDELELLPTALHEYSKNMRRGAKDASSSYLKLLWMGRADVADKLIEKLYELPFWGENESDR